MIDWVFVLAALCVGLSLGAARAARRETFAHPTTRLFVWGVPAVVALIAVAGAGLNIVSEAGGHLALPAARAVSLPGAAPVPAVNPTAALPLAANAPAAPIFAGERTDPAGHPPARLSIPALGVDEPVLTIPLRAGQWDLNELGPGIGWLESTGARPGDALAMVFIGHMTVSARERGAFAELQHLPLGAEISYTANGQVFTYTVVEKGRMESEDVNRVYQPGGNTLLLVTCADWDETTRTYLRRLLVRAVQTAEPAAGAR